MFTGPREVHIIVEVYRGTAPPSRSRRFVPIVRSEPHPIAERHPTAGSDPTAVTRPTSEEKEPSVRDAFTDELESINQSLIEMTNLVASAMARATTALLDADLQLAENVISGDETVDLLRNEIEERAFDVMARQAPVATDLRMMVTTLRIVADLERMGDLALHVAKVARRRYPGRAVPPELRGTLLEMGQVAQRIVAKAGSVIASRDTDLAKQLEADDDAMDGLHRTLFHVLIEKPWRHGMEAAIDITLCGRYYERYADHAVSVARRVIYLVTGEITTS